MKWEQLTLFNITSTPSVVCSICRKKTSFPGVRKDTLPGCTYDCACGKVMRITREYKTVDLYVEMAKRIRETYGADVQPEDFMALEIGVNDVGDAS